MELEIETHVAQMMGRAHTKAPDSNLIEPSEPGEGEDKTYLLFTTGSLTYSPHQIGMVVSKLRGPNQIQFNTCMKLCVRKIRHGASPFT